MNVWVLNKHFSWPFISIPGFFSGRLIIFQMGHSLGSGSEKAMILVKILSLACEYLFKSLELFISGLRMFVPELDPSYCFPYFSTSHLCAHPHLWFSLLNNLFKVAGILCFFSLLLETIATKAYHQIDKVLQKF